MPTNSTPKLTLSERMAFALQDSGLYPYPEFVTLFVALFDNKATKEQATKEQATRAEKLIAGGMNRKKLAKHFDVMYKEYSSVTK